WGKIKYDSKPTVTTLNALAKFNGFENWRSFQQIGTKKITSNEVESLQEFKESEVHPPIEIIDQKRTLKSKLYVAIPIVLILISSFFLFSINEKTTSPLNK